MRDGSDGWFSVALQAAQEQETGIMKALIEGRADVNKAGSQPRSSGGVLGLISG